MTTPRDTGETGTVETGLRGEQMTTPTTAGLGQALAGCAACCDGVVSQARAADLSQDIITRLEEVCRLWRQLAEELGAGMAEPTGSR